MRDNDDLLDIAQAAAFLNVSETSLRRWTNAGQLRCLRIGGRRERRFRRADLVAFMKAEPGRVPHAAAADRIAEDHTIIDGLVITHGTHLAALYSSDLGRVQLSVQFLKDGLKPGQLSMLVGSKKFRAEVLEQLAQSYADLDDHLKQKRLVSIAHEKTIDAQLERFDRMLRAAVAAGATSIRIVGDVSDFIEAVGARFVEFEAALDRFIARQFPVVILCLFDVRRLTGSDVFNALKLHPQNLEHPPDRWLA